MTKIIPEIDPEKCTGCGDCVEQCPTDAVAVIDGKAAVVKPEDCNYCTWCEAFCPSNAIRCPFEIILAKNCQKSLRFELAGLAFACGKGFSPGEYAQHLWSKGAISWMGKAKPGAAEYLLKEAKAFQEFYPEVSFEIVMATAARAELIFTNGCLGGWGNAPWALARSLGLTRKDVCAYCCEAFLVWAAQLGLSVNIAPEKDEVCCLRVVKP